MLNPHGLSMIVKAHVLLRAYVVTLIPLEMQTLSFWHLVLRIVHADALMLGALCRRQRGLHERTVSTSPTDYSSCWSQHVASESFRVGDALAPKDDSQVWGPFLHQNEPPSWGMPSPTLSPLSLG